MGGTLRVSSGSGWGDGPIDYRFARIEFKGPRGKHQHSLCLNDHNVREFANLLETCVGVDPQYHKAMINLMGYLYFNAAKRFRLYIDNAVELSTVLFMFADEQDKAKK